MLAVASIVGVVGGTGYTLAVNDVAQGLLVAAVSTAVAVGWAESRHAAAVRRDIVGLPPRPRRPGDDNPQFLGSIQ